MTVPLTREECEAFMRNPTINPFTGANFRTRNGDRETFAREVCEYILRGEEVPAALLARNPNRSRTASARTQHHHPHGGVDVFRFNQEVLEHEEVARALWSYGRGDNFHTSFIREGTDDMTDFLQQVNATYPHEWIQRYRISGIRRQPFPSFQNPFPHIQLSHRRVPFNGHMLTYKEVAIMLYDIMHAIATQTILQITDIIRTHEDAREFLRTITQIFPEDWINYYVTAARNNMPMPRYIEPSHVNLPHVRPPSPSPLNKPKTISPTTPDEQTIANTCKTMLHGITKDPFRVLAHKMKKICTTFVQKCDNQRIKEVRGVIRTKQYIYHDQIENITLDPSYAFQQVVSGNKNKNETKRILFMNVFKRNWGSVSIKYKGQRGVGEGVMRDFVQNCLNAVKNNPTSERPQDNVKFFMPIYPGSNRYVINPKFTIQQAKQLGYNNVKSEADVLHIYYMIGQLFAFCTRYDVPVPIYLSRTILASILHKQEHITPEMSIMYYLMDSDPDVAKSTVDLMRIPEHIEYTMINMNDDFPLVHSDEDIPVTADNYIQYIDKYSRHKFLHQFQKDAINTHDRLKAFIDGFYIQKTLKANNVTVRELEKMMCGASVSMQTIREWLRSGHIEYNINQNADAEKQTQVVNWFKEIVNEMGETIPLDEFNRELLKQKEGSEASSSRSSDSSTARRIRSKKTAFMLFFMNLMQFWTSYRKIDMESKHQVRFERPRGLPTSHTCFYQLCLPYEDVSSKADLYKRLITATFGVEQGIGLI
jgi:hypothetical protein